MRDLVVRGHEVTAFAKSDHGKPWTVDGVTVETARQGLTRAFRLAADFDVVVSHAGDGGVGAKTARHGQLPHVVLVHGQMRKVEGDLVVFNSHWMQRAVQHDCPAIVCHPVTDPAAWETASGDHVTIVNCARFKGIITAWKAAELLPEHRFLGVMGGYLEQVVPRAKNFETIPTTHNMRDDVYARTRVLLMPSEHETWGMVAVEAMCSGIPVIAHPSPGLLESLGDAGIFVDRNDFDGWVDEIRRLDDPDEYAAASAKAKARVAELEPEMRAGLDRFADAVEALA